MKVNVKYFNIPLKLIKLPKHSIQDFIPKRVILKYKSLSNGHVLHLMQRMHLLFALNQDNLFNNQHQKGITKIPSLTYLRL